MSKKNYHPIKALAIKQVAKDFNVTAIYVRQALGGKHPVSPRGKKMIARVNVLVIKIEKILTTNH